MPRPKSTHKAPSASPWSVEMNHADRTFVLTRVTPQEEPIQYVQPPANPPPQYNNYPQSGTHGAPPPRQHPPGFQAGVSHPPGFQATTTLPPGFQAGTPRPPGSQATMSHPPGFQAGTPRPPVSPHPQAQSVRSSPHAPPSQNTGAPTTHPYHQAQNAQVVRLPSHAHAPPPQHQNRAPATSMHPPNLQQRFQSTQAPPRFPPEHEEVARRVNAAALQRGVIPPSISRAQLPYPETPPQPIPTRLLSGGLPYPETAKQDAQRELDRLRGRDQRR